MHYFFLELHAYTFYTNFLSTENFIKWNYLYCVNNFFLIAIKSYSQTRKYKRWGLSLGSLRSYYGDAEVNVDLKINVHFTYASRDTLKSLTLFITVKAITKLNLRHRDKFDIEV